MAARNMKTHTHKAWERGKKVTMLIIIYYRTSITLIVIVLVIYILHLSKCTCNVISWIFVKCCSRTQTGYGRIR